MTATYRRVSGLTGRPQRLLWDTIPGPTKPPTKTPKPFTAKHGAAGSWVSWDEPTWDHRLNRPGPAMSRTGQVWCLLSGGAVAVVTDDQKIHEVTPDRLRPADMNTEAAA